MIYLKTILFTALIIVVISTCVSVISYFTMPKDSVATLDGATVTDRVPFFTGSFFANLATPFRSLYVVDQGWVSQKNSTGPTTLWSIIASLLLWVIVFIGVYKFSNLSYLLRIGFVVLLISTPFISAVCTYLFQDRIMIN